MKPLKSGRLRKVPGYLDIWFYKPILITYCAASGHFQNHQVPYILFYFGILGMSRLNRLDENFICKNENTRGFLGVIELCNSMSYYFNSGYY